VIAAAAFVLSPYFLFIDPLMRGDLAEFFALSLLPWVFLAFDEPAVSYRKVAVRSIILAVLIFSHNLVALMGLALLIAYLAWRGLFMDTPRRWQRDAVAIALAIGLTAIFWLPFLIERNAVRLDVAGPGHFDYHNHFVPLSMLLSPSPALDFGATSPKYIYNLGLIQWLCWIPALVWSVLKRKAMIAKITLFFAIIAALLTFLILPASTFIWDAIPATAYIQFPWRLLGPIAFALAMGSAAAVSGLSSVVGRRSSVVAPIVLVGLFITALPTMYPPLWDANFGDTSPRGMIDFELSGVALGTTSTSDFLPTPVGTMPPANQSLLDSYSSSVIDKFDHSSLPVGGTALAEKHAANFDRFHVDSPINFRARILTFLFPGWHAYVDGSEVLIKPEDQSGLITFPVPAGSHTVEVSLQLTQPQLIGTFVSIATVMGVVVLALLKRLAKSTGALRRASTLSFPLSVSPSLLLTIGIIFLATKIVVLDRCDSCFRYTSPPGQVLGAQFKQMAHVGGHIDLLGYDLPSLEVESGGVLPLTLYWKATAPVPKNYQVFAHLAQPGVAPWGQSDKLNPGDFPTTRWPLDKYVWDDHRLSIRPDTPPGDYHLSVGLYTLGDGQRAPVFDNNGQIIGDSVTLDAIVHVTSPH